MLHAGKPSPRKVSHSRSLSSPHSPQTIEELGVPPFMVHDLALRYLLEHGSGSLSVLRKGLKISHSVADSILQQLRQQQFVEIKGTIGGDFLFTLTNAARQYVADRSDTCRYAGPVPVTLDHYTRVVRSQRTVVTPTVEVLRKAFSDLVLTEAALDRLGPALVSQRPLFIYGPSGSGKTSLIERFGKVFDDPILIPYALEVDAHIISVFDPQVHQPVAEVSDAIDERWVRCHRPCVMAAGELVGAMLNLRLDEPSGVYTAPLQMKANNGVLLIDDFGRQAMSPRELLNRWILPLDRRIDYLTLKYGLTFQIPFEPVVAFATNLDPASLADEAFLRRVPNKIYVGPVSDEVFDRIFERVLQQYGLPFEASMAAYLRSLCRQRNPSGLRACYPRDICEILLASSQYKQQPFHVSRQNLNMAVDSYFVHSAEEIE